MKKKVYIIIALIIAFILTYTAYNTSIIKISVSGQQAGAKISYNFISQSGKSAARSSSDNPILKQRLPKGNFEVEVTQNGRSSIQLVQMRGWLSTTTVSAGLQSEKSRTFVGNNPADCMSYVGGVLISYACGDSYLSASIHVPATSDIPTYKSVVSGSLVNGVIEGSVETNQGALVLVKSNGDTGAGNYSVYQVDSGFHPIASMALTNLNPNKSYLLSSRLNGFVVYSTDFISAFYYSSLGSSPQDLSISQSNNTKLFPGNVDFNPTNGQAIALYVSSSSNNGSKGSSEVALGQDGKAQRYTFKHRYTSVGFCGSEFCLLDPANHLDIYSLSGGKMKLLLSIGGIQSIKRVGNQFLLVNGNGVVDFDANNQTGYFDYSFGVYKYCGLQPVSQSSYVICLTNPKGSRVALLIDTTMNDSDSIDKKVAQLLSLSEINNISAYGRYIYLSPNLGSPQNLPGGGVGYNPTTEKSVASQINKDASRMGVDTSKYQIINPYAP